MWGAVIGDIAGSRFEGSRSGPKDFELYHAHCMYTDDSVCSRGHPPERPKARLNTSGLVPAPPRARLRRVLSQMGRQCRSFAVRELREWRRHAGRSRGAPPPTETPGGSARGKRPGYGDHARPSRGHQGSPGRDRGGLARPRAEKGRKRCDAKSRSGTATTSDRVSKPSGPPTGSTSPAKARCQPRSFARSNPRASRTQSATPYLLEGMRTPSRRLPAQWEKRCTDCLKGSFRLRGSRYLQNAEDITETLEALYERATQEAGTGHSTLSA